MIVGIDNGIDGGLCAIDRITGEVKNKTPMLTYSRKGKNEADPLAVFQWLESVFQSAPESIPFIVIEEPLKHAGSSQSMRSMSINFGKLLGVIESAPWAVETFFPLEWQRPMLGRVAKSKTKARALVVAQELAPDENWLANSRCWVPHDGMVDAFLIAQFYKLHKL